MNNINNDLGIMFEMGMQQQMQDADGDGIVDHIDRHPNSPTKKGGSQGLKSYDPIQSLLDPSIQGQRKQAEASIATSNIMSTNPVEKANIQMATAKDAPADVRAAAAAFIGMGTVGSVNGEQRNSKKDIEVLEQVSFGDACIDINERTGDATITISSGQSWNIPFNPAPTSHKKVQRK